MTRIITHLAIGDRLIGPGEPAYIIAEAGINHNGNPELARKLIDVAVASGVDAVKFQKRTLETLYSARTLDDPTREEKEIGFLLPYLQQAELSEEVMRDLSGYCAERGVEFICSPWDIESVDFLESIGIRCYKVASADLTNLPLLEHLAATGKPLILSTGMSSLDEIATTVEMLHQRGVQFALLHCQSTYPAPFKDINLRFMERLREFGVPVGYSGHERGIAVSTAAVAMGACIIERHITLDRTMPGPDHAASLEPVGLEKQVRDIRNVEQAMGKPKRVRSRGELLNRLALGKSLVAARPIRAGEVIAADMIKVMGPGHGILPQRMGELIGRTARRDIAQDEQFRETDLSDASLEELAGGFPLRWGPVVRYRDLDRMTRFHPDLFEFHLTDTDLDAEIPDLPSFSQELVIHAPEYYHGRLLNFCSPDRATVQTSMDVLRRVMDIARELRPHFSGTPERVRVVSHPGAMSYEPEPDTRADLVARLCDNLPQLLAEPGVEVLMENMPPYPWYFGGQWYHDAFMAVEDWLQLVEATGARLCFDVSHAALACAAGHGDLLEFTRLIAPHTAHVHIADASGTDGEGLQIGEGEVPFEDIMPVLQGLDVGFIPEIWMGHRNDGEGFVIALNRLAKFVR
ncbi:MAG: N-acetylneuraminate synthase family protein [Armatimonadetes bacterium]|nr:N-acetylneuraminate synthase family protein [Armatimonadota bacterium]